MARPRKNAARAQGALLTPDNVVEIPVEEQSYPLPEEWRWVRLGDIAEIVMGQSPSGADTTDDSSYTPLIGGASDMGQFYPEATKYTKRPTKLSNKNDIIVCIRATLGRPIFSNGEYCLGRGVAAIRSNKISNQFTRFLFINFEQYLYDNATGTTFAQVNSDTLNKMPIPLPPLDEQQRIVDRIESLFAKLDDAKAKAEAVLDGFEIRKAAILHKAFTGELTAKWRDEREITKSSWQTIPFCQAATIKSNLVDPTDFQNLPHIAPDNIEKKTGQLLKYRTIAEDKVTSAKHRFYPGQILYSKIRPYLSKVVIIDFNGLCSADMYPIDAKEDTKYLWYYMLSGDFLEHASSAGSRSVLPKINQKELSRITIRRPSLPEQQEVVRILDNLLAKEQRAKEAAETVLTQIDLMKKAILAKVFRGELGTHIAD